MKNSEKYTVISLLTSVASSFILTISLTRNLGASLAAAIFVLSFTATLGLIAEAIEKRLITLEKTIQSNNGRI